MKKIITILMLSLSVLSFGQATDIKYVNNILPENVVNEFAVKKAQSEIYLKSLNWIKETYKNPQEVIKTTIENEMIRFEGIEKSGTVTKSLGMPIYYDIKYTISLYFKEGKYKFEINSIDYAVGNPGGDTNLKDVNFCYKKDGRLRSIFATTPSDIEKIVNNLNQSLYSYIEKESTVKSDW